MTQSIRRILAALILVATAISLSGCGDDAPRLNALSQDAVILAFGDSLTYGTGANHKTESYPAVLANLSRRTVINAGIPGEVSREGLERLGQLLDEYQPDLVLLCHGGNDLIRKLDETALSNNLSEMVAQIRARGAQVVMVSVPKPGIFLKPAVLYSELANELQVPIENDIIAEVESETALKSDPIHPNARGYRIIAEEIHQLLLDSGAF